MLPADAGHEQIDVSVIVVIGGRNSHRVSSTGHSGLRGYVPEFEIAQVAIEMVRVPRGVLLEAGKRCPIREINIRQAIAVIIERRDSAGIVSGRYFRSVGQFSSMKSMPACLATFLNWTLPETHAV